LPFRNKVTFLSISNVMNECRLLTLAALIACKGRWQRTELRRPDANWWTFDDWIVSRRDLESSGDVGRWLLRHQLVTTAVTLYRLESTAEWRDRDVWRSDGVSSHYVDELTVVSVYDYRGGPCLWGLTVCPPYWSCDPCRSVAVGRVKAVRCPLFKSFGTPTDCPQSRIHFGSRIELCYLVSIIFGNFGLIISSL